MSDQGALFEPVDDRKDWQRSTHDHAHELAMGRAARDEAVSRVDVAVDVEWRDRALEAGIKVATSQAELIADDLWHHVEKPREPRATGPVMSKLWRMGYIEPTSRYRPVPSRTRHAAPVRIWRSLIYRGSDG